MSDLERLQTILSDGAEDSFLREALDSARDDVPDAARRAATLSALSPDAASKPAKNARVNATAPPPPNEPATEAANGAPAPAIASGATLKWVVIVGLAAGALAIGLYATSSPTSAPVPAVDVPVAQPLASGASAASIAPSASIPPIASIPPLDTAIASGQALRVDTAPKPSAVPKAPATPLGLAEETAILDRARSALNRGDARGALAELDRYDAAPSPKILGQEATMVRIEALSAKGDTAGARTLARSFLANNPGSTYDDRVRALIAEPKQPEPKP